jgi:CubicO group peptidase (beta-lactamase class C family)
MRSSVRVWILAFALNSSMASPRTEPAKPDLDSLIRAEMAACHIPGLAACAVRGSELIWRGEYGFARLEDSIPVVDSTVFDLASVSKTATAVSLMQLCERGVFRLDDDINGALPFSVRHPAYPDRPVTFRMLMTHTSGIADNWPIFLGLQCHGDPQVGLRRFVEGYLVPGGEFYDSAGNFCPWPPGGDYQYSNIAMALAGYLVEAVGDSFPRYTRDSLFLPLGMNRTVWYFHDIDTNTMAMPYDYAGGNYVRFGHQSLPDVPAGEMKSSALQLGRFLSMMLGWGRLDGTRVLDSATVVQMTTIQHPAGVGLAWHHGYVGPHEVWSHTGGWTGMSTWIGFCQADNTGAVVLCNMTGVHGSILGVIAPALLDLAAGVEDLPKSPVSWHEPAASILSGFLFLPEAPDHRGRSARRLLSATGREAMELHVGANDVRGLAPGVYFVAEDCANNTVRARKVVVTR